MYFSRGAADFKHWVWAKSPRTNAERANLFGNALNDAMMMTGFAICEFSKSKFTEIEVSLDLGNDKPGEFEPTFKIDFDEMLATDLEYGNRLDFENRLKAISEVVEKYKKLSAIAE